MDIPSGLVKAVEEQNAVLFLGAAASFGAKHPNGAAIPSGGQLRDALSDKFLSGELKHRPLAAVAEYANSEAGLPKVQLFVRDLFKEFEPSPAHLLVPRFRWHGIATTNYDLVIEKAYAGCDAAQQTLVRFVKDGQHVETEMKKTGNGVQYLKLHGCIDHYIDSEIPLILATEQYAKYITHRKRLFQRLHDWGREFPLVFCGYSLSDPDILSVLYELFELGLERPMYYLIDPHLTSREEAYWMGRRITPYRATFSEFMTQLDAAVSPMSRMLPRSVGGGSSTLRSHYKVANAIESSDLLAFLTNDVEHIRPGMPVAKASPREFYRGEDNGWGAIEAGLDAPRAVTDSILVDAVLLGEDERVERADLYVVKGPGGNGKTVVLKRAAWAAAHDYQKIVLYLRRGGALRTVALEEIYRLCKERIYIFVDQAALYVDDIERVLRWARASDLPLTLVVSERDAEWNVRCEAIDELVGRDFPVRYLSEKEVRDLLVNLERYDSLGMLAEVTFEERVKRLMEGAQRQLLVALHEATHGKRFEEIVLEEYQRIIPKEAQDLYLDICTLNRLGVAVRAGLITRISGLTFNVFAQRLFKPLEHIVSTYHDRYIGDMTYSARHQHVAEMVFDAVLSQPEDRYTQVVRVLRGMNLDYSADEQAFGQLIRGRTVIAAFDSQELGRRFYDVAMEVAEREAYVLQQRGIFEMEHPGGSLALAEQYLNAAADIEPHNRTIQHSLANLARKQALDTGNPLLRRRLRERARARLAPQLGADAENSVAFYTAAQVALDDLKDLIRDSRSDDLSDAARDRQIVDSARDVERCLQEGLQKFPENENLLAVEADYRDLMKQSAQAEAALRRAFASNPRMDWIAARLARALIESGKIEDAKTVLRQCEHENPASKRIHFELARIYRDYGSPVEKRLVIEHLRRGFTEGDHNYEAQFWYYRECFLAGNFPEAKSGFARLRAARLSPAIRNAVRGIVLQDGSRQPQQFEGEVLRNPEDAYLFIKCAHFPDNIFFHRSRVSDDVWKQLRRGTMIRFTLGFAMTGPIAASIAVSSG